MKIPSSQLKFYAGKNKSKKVYEVHHFYKDKIPANIAKSLKSQIDSKVFQADAGQQYIDHGDQIIYIGLGEEAKLTLRKLASYYLKLGEAFIKWVGIGLEIHISKELSEALSPFNLVYQLANSIEIAAFGVDSLSKTYRERKIEVGDISFVMESVKEEKTAKEALEKSKVVSKYLNESRYVAHLPANHFTPEEFVSRSQEIAKENKLKITVFDEDRLKKEKFSGILLEREHIERHVHSHSKTSLLLYFSHQCLLRSLFPIHPTAHRLPHTWLVVVFTAALKHKHLSIAPSDNSFDCEKILHADFFQKLQFYCTRPKTNHR